MDHEAYEKQMIDIVNRHSEEFSEETCTVDSTLTESDAQTMSRGIKRIVVAALTVFVFVVSVHFFAAVATATGYWAVVLFFVAIWLMLAAVVLMYALGIDNVRSRGDSK